MEPRELIHHIEETRTSAKEYTGGFEITGGSRQEGPLYVSSWAGTKLERCNQIRASEQLGCEAPRRVQIMSKSLYMVIEHYKNGDAVPVAKEERKALPDMEVKVNQILAERDLVAVYWTSSGTNTQAGMGFPATGKKDQD